MGISSSIGTSGVFDVPISELIDTASRRIVFLGFFSVMRRDSTTSGGTDRSLRCIFSAWVGVTSAEGGVDKERCIFGGRRPLTDPVMVVTVEFSLEAIDDLL